MIPPGVLPRRGSLIWALCLTLEEFVDVRCMALMALLFCFVSVVPLAAANAQAPAADTSLKMASDNPAGRWMTPSHDAVIQIAPCGAEMCGQIVGMVLGPNDPVPKNWAGVSQCRLTIIRTAPDVDGDGRVVWRGTIVNPRDGAAYHAQIMLGADHNLKLRGYVGLPIFGRTQSWTAYEGPNVPADCRLAQTASS